MRWDVISVAGMLQQSGLSVCLSVCDREIAGGFRLSV